MCITISIQCSNSDSHIGRLTFPPFSSFLADIICYQSLFYLCDDLFVSHSVPGFWSIRECYMYSPLVGQPANQKDSKLDHTDRL